MLSQLEKQVTLYTAVWSHQRLVGRHSVTGAGKVSGGGTCQGIAVHLQKLSPPDILNLC